MTKKRQLVSEIGTSKETRTVFSPRHDCEKESRSEQRNNTGEVNKQSNQEINSTSEPDESDHSSTRYQQREEESEMIPVDDASPMTFSTV